MTKNLSSPNTQDQPTLRILTALSQIAKLGPITLTNLTHHVDFGRSSLHRSCEKLINIGWIRQRPTDKAYQLTQHLEHMFATANYATAEETFVEPWFLKIKADGMFHATLSAFTHTGVFTDLESTRPVHQWDKTHSLVFPPAAIIAQTLCLPEQRLETPDNFPEIRTC